MFLMEIKMEIESTNTTFYSSNKCLNVRNIHFFRMKIIKKDLKPLCKQLKSGDFIATMLRRNKSLQIITYLH